MSGKDENRGEKIDELKEVDSLAAVENTTDDVVAADADAQQAAKGDSRRGGGRSGGQGRGDRGNNRGGGNRGRRKGRGEEREEKEFLEELLQIDRVTRVVKGGRRLRFRATVAIGDRKGRVGFGVDKATEVPQAIAKAVRNARKNLIEVSIRNGTIPHEVRMKFKASKILIMPAKAGTGIIAGGSMRKIADLAGIEDMLGKNFGSNNRITSGKAMMLALAKFASNRNKKVKKSDGDGGQTPQATPANSEVLSESASA